MSVGHGVTDHPWRHLKASYPITLSPRSSVLIPAKPVRPRRSSRPSRSPAERSSREAILRKAVQRGPPEATFRPLAQTNHFIYIY